MAHRERIRALLSEAAACSSSDPQRVVTLLTPLMNAPIIDLVDDAKARIALASAYDALGLPTMSLVVLEDALKVVEIACIGGVLAHEVACVYYKDLAVAMAKADAKRGDDARELAARAYGFAHIALTKALVLHAQGAVEMAIGTDYEKAMQFFLRAEEHNVQEGTRFHHRIMSCAKDMLRFDIVMERAKQLWSEEPEERTKRRGHCVVIADAYDHLGEYEKSLEWWRRARSMAMSATDAADFTDDDCEMAIAVVSSQARYAHRKTLLKSKYRMCRKCELVATDLQTCSRCRCAWYCNSKCSAADWTEHKKICYKRE